MDKDKALKLALEFVENVHWGEWQGSTERQEEVVTVINKALAQPAQEPVAGERLIPKLDRLGAEAGIKQMTSEIYNFALLVRADVVAQWPERPWVGLTDEEVVNLGYSADGNVCTAVRLAAVYIKEKNNGTTP